MSKFPGSFFAQKKIFPYNCSIFFSKYWNAKPFKYFALLNFRTSETFPVFPAFPVFLEKKRGKFGKKSCSIRPALSDAIQLTNLSRQVGWRNQLMASRLGDLSLASEASQISPSQPRGTCRHCFSSGAYQPKYEKRKAIKKIFPAFSTRVAVAIVFVALFALGVPSATPPPRALQFDLRRDNGRFQSNRRE